MNIYNWVERIQKYCCGSDSLYGQWHLINVVSSLIYTDLKSEIKQWGLLREKKEKITDCRKKMITSVPNTTERKSYSEEWPMCSSAMATLKQEEEVEKKGSKKNLRFSLEKKRIKLIFY